MLPGSVYSPAMQMNARAALIQRIGRLLHAKESLVFYAIGLGVLDFAAPLATGWLFRHRSLAALLGTGNSVVGDAAAGRRFAVLAVAAAYLLVSTFFTAGYLRSLLGKLHWGPRDARQYARLLALLALVAAISWGVTAFENAVTGHVSDTAILLIVFAGQTVIYVPLLYAEYAIVASNVGVGRALVRSVQTFVANGFVSLLVLFGLFEISLLLWQLLPGSSGDALSLGPTVVLHIVVWGSVSFLSDVVLLSVYIDSIERGTIPPN
jgi:hypothetical protein